MNSITNKITTYYKIFNISKIIIYTRNKEEMIIPAIAKPLPFFITFDFFNPIIDNVSPTTGSKEKIKPKIEKIFFLVSLLASLFLLALPLFYYCASTKSNKKIIPRKIILFNYII